MSFRCIAFHVPVAAVLLTASSPRPAFAQEDTNDATEEALPPVPMVRGPTVMVTVDADAGGVVVERRWNGAWLAMCRAPCNRALPISGEYRIRGEGLRSSSPFELDGVAGQPLRLEVTTRSSGRFHAGLIAIVLGSAMEVAGVLLLASPAASAYSGGMPTTVGAFTGGTGSSSSSTSTIAPVLLMTAGLGVIGTGIALSATARGSTVVIDRSGRAKNDIERRVRPRHEREDVWHSARAPSPAQAPDTGQTWMLPLASGSF